MKWVCLLACCAVLGGCMHSAPGAKKEAPAPAAKQEKPELSAALVETTIIKGKTTREELVAKLGPPNSVEKHPYHVPKVTAPGFKMDVPPKMMAVETWFWWTIRGGMRTFLVEVYIDETGAALDYKINDKKVVPSP